MAPIDLREWAASTGLSLFDLGLAFGAAEATADGLSAQLGRQEERFRNAPDVDLLLGVQHAVAGQRIVLARLTEIRTLWRLEVG